MRRWLVAWTALAVVLAHGATDGRAQTITQSDRSVVIDGSLTYAWHGDPARGCATARVCGISGTTIITPGDGSGDVSLNGRRPGELDFSGGAATVRVQRVESDGNGQRLRRVA